MSFVAACLGESGHHVSEFLATDVEALFGFLARERPDAVFNCCESFRGATGLEMNVAALLELSGIPFTGATALTLGMALDKEIAGELFRAAGVPAPRGVVLRDPDQAGPAVALGWPLIVKLVREDGSIGIAADAVVADRHALRYRVAHVLRRHRQPARVEEYIHGREFAVSLLETGAGELVALPVSEVEFRGLPEGAPRVLTYASKWEEHSTEYGNTVPQCPASIDAELAARLQATALAAAQALRLTGYGRVDLRLRDDGAVFVLEVNPNPDLNASAGFMRAARASGRSDGETISEILAAALRRHAAAGPAPDRPVLRDHGVSHVRELRVDPLLLKCRFARGTSMSRCTGVCCEEGAWIDLAHRDRILGVADIVREYMEPTQEHDAALWFDPGEMEDADFESGRAISTAAIGGACVFLDSQRRCVLHRAEEKIPNLKPFFCRAYPIVICDGELTVDDESVAGMEQCCTPVAGGDLTVFDVCEGELEHVLGAAGLRELRRLSGNGAAPGAPGSAGATAS